MIYGNNLLNRNRPQKSCSCSACSRYCILSFSRPESEWKVIASGNDGRKQVTASRACRRAAFAILIPSSNWSFSSNAVLRPHCITTPSLSSAQIYQACKESIATSSFSVSGTKHSIVLASAKWSCQDCAGKHNSGMGMIGMIGMIFLVFWHNVWPTQSKKTAPSDCDRAFAHWLRTELPLLIPRHYAIWIQSWNQFAVLDPILTSRKVWPQCHLDCGTEWGRFLYAE